MAWRIAPLTRIAASRTQGNNDPLLRLESENRRRVKPPCSGRAWGLALERSDPFETGAAK